MGDVLIKGMEMPKACVYRENGHLTTCPLYDIDGYCGALNTEASHNEDGKLQGCPLVPVPPHGDLIDRAALRESFRESIEACHKWADEMREAENEEIVIRAEQSLCTFVECSLRAKSAPTIIPAEEAGQDARDGP